MNKKFKDEHDWLFSDSILKRAAAILYYWTFGMVVILLGLGLFNTIFHVWS